MARGYIDTETDICALASAPGQGALAVIRIVGPACVQKAARLFSRPDALRAAAGNSTVYGFIMDGEGNKVDEVVAVVFRAPASYTGGDGIDIMCHGGSVTADRILAALQTGGFSRALPGEFTFRAFVNGKMDLARAEAVDELVKARTAAAQSDALSRLAGGLSGEILAIHAELVRLAAACALRLDYGEDESPEDFSAELPALRGARDACLTLAETYALGRLMREGATVAIAGRTNAGKSSLFNRFLKEERAIVSDTHGTTRDYVSAGLDLHGLPVTIVDTAGLRETPDFVEAEGVRRSRLVSESADAVLYLVDATQGIHPDDAEFISANPTALPVWNKVDDRAALPCPDGWIPVSALAGTGERVLADALRLRILGIGAGGAGMPASPVSAHTITSARQRDALLRAAAALDDALLLTADSAALALDMLAIDIAAALHALGEISGETSSEDILDSLFSNFCVGK